MGDVVDLGPHSKMSVEEAMAVCAREVPEMGEVLIIGTWTESGVFFVRSSNMSRKDALWLAEHLKAWALGY